MNIKYQPLNRKIQYILSKRWVCLTISLLVLLAMVILSNLLAKMTLNLIESVLNINKGINFNIPNPFIFDFENLKWIYLIALIFGIFCSIRMFYELKINYGELATGQKGTRRWAKPDELNQEYRFVPEKEKFFNGKPGFPISRHDKKVYIDDTSVNNLINGTTRSGKGELYCFPMLDIYSRAKDIKNRASFVVTDPKGELAAASKETLEKRGYRVHILDLVSFKGMSYNPLALITKAYLSDDISIAQMLTNTFSHVLFNDPNPHDKEWQNWAIALSNALILAHVIDCCENAKLCDDEKDKVEWLDKINMYSVARLLIDNADNNHEDSPKSRLDKFFERRPVDDAAKMQYAAVLSAPYKTKGGIFAMVLSQFVKFTADNIARTSVKNSCDMKSVGFDENTPTAIFIVISDNDRSNHFLATIFISQLYFALTKECMQKGGKCKREVIFILDEFGNIVAIPDFSNMITACLGRNIKFTIIVQAYSQISNLYGNDNAKTIIGNCGNQIYILTVELDTAEQFSKMIGNETIVIHSRNGSPFSLKKNMTEHVDTKPLLNAAELMELIPGESVICRVMYRHDIKGNKIKPNPIFNHDENIMKHRYEYLNDTFDTSKSIYEILNSTNYQDHHNIHLENCVYTPIKNELEVMYDNLSSHKIYISTVLTAKTINRLIDLLLSIPDTSFSKSDILKMNITELDRTIKELVDLNKISLSDYYFIDKLIYDETNIDN